MTGASVSVSHTVALPGSDATQVANVFVTHPPVVYRVHRLPSLASARLAAKRSRSRVGWMLHTRGGDIPRSRRRAQYGCQYSSLLAGLLANSPARTRQFSQIVFSSA